MADIFDEVEQDLRAERARRAFARYGGLLAAFALLVLVAVGGVQGWRWWQAEASRKAASAYLAATSTVTEAAGTPAARFAELATSAPSGYAILARLRAAAAAGEQGDNGAARGHWNALGSSAAPPLYRDLGTVLWALSAIGTAPRAEIEAKLLPLADGPWRASVTEIRALAARAAGDVEAANRGFAALLADPATPAGIRLRADRLRDGEGG